MAQFLLHGTLHVTIFEARNLKSSPISAATASTIIAKAPTFLKKKFNNGYSLIRRASFCGPRKYAETKARSWGMYATIDVEKARLGRTRIVGGSSPGWFETFHIPCAHMAADVVFTVKESAVVGAVLIGRAYLPVGEIISGRAFHNWLDICDDDKNPLQTGARIRVSLQYVDVSKDLEWGAGLVPLQFSGVNNTYFPQRRTCAVKLYQDAHVLDGFDNKPKIPLAGDEFYEAARCWEDVFDAITSAKHFIYITGWSVNTTIKLIRDPARWRRSGDDSLGQLLKTKAEEGVLVLMLVWDDRTSVEQLKRDGLMATHDQQTLDYFINTKVHCILCPRDPDDAGSFVQDFQVATMFTHHQKTLIVDTAAGGKRRVTSFVGGIDLCDGRYDTQSHSLFRTLTGAHRDDFHQPNFPNSSIKHGGPREPWHDIHSRLDGPVAHDVLANFEQRWRKQSNQPQLLLNLSKMTNIFIPDTTPATSADDMNTWDVQIFRSIDGGAAAGLPRNPVDAERAGLVSGKDQVIDCSIHKAYIAAIRRAKNFIYIENQYFLGSSYDWRSVDDIKVEDIGALHLIPKELSLKVVSKIEKGERFAVYVVIPMWPEGVPESSSVQAILDWQRRTMEMMYADIALALQAKGLNAHPRDYLNFYCLGNREVKENGEPAPEDPPKPETNYARAQETRRFMIYVHAKMMIVDDEYIIVGSANINQRSMDGARDTEIAMGASQPHHLAANAHGSYLRPRGQIYGFRRCLWREHLLGAWDDAFLEPESLACVRKMNQIAETNWDMYAREELKGDLPGHLLTYPVEIDNDGHVRQRPGVEFFPDTKARVLGQKSDYLPPILTT